MRHWIATIVVIAILGAIAWIVPERRRVLIRAITTYDAEPTDPAPLPGGSGPPLARSAHTRVVLIDGLTKQIASTLPRWTALCKTGTTLDIDVGFPTVSLPVEVSLWTGLTQQQTGVVFRSNRPLEPPLDKKGIPAQIAGSHAVAEYYGYIVRSLGFAIAEPAMDPQAHGKDLAPEEWKTQWQARALDAVKSPSPLVFVHLLRVDTTGHKHGIGVEYLKAATEADAIVGSLIDADPSARWFLLSDHGHIPTGGHGGEERDVRHVQGCIAGGGVPVAVAGPVHIVDVARAIADSVGATLDPASRGRPLVAAVASPLAPDQGVPPMGLGAGAIAIFILVAGLALSSWGVRKWYLAPWWFVMAGALLIAIRGLPSLSTPMIYKPEGRDMYLAWLPALAVAMASTAVGVYRTPIARVVVAQLALPFAAVAAAVTAAGAWNALVGDPTAPVVPYVTAWMSPLLLVAAHGAAVVALAVLATSVHRSFGRRAPAEPPRTEREAAPPPPDASS